MWTYVTANMLSWRLGWLSTITHKALKKWMLCDNGGSVLFIFEITSHSIDVIAHISLLHLINEVVELTCFVRMGNLLLYSFHAVSCPPWGWGQNRPSLPATQQRDEYHCVKSLLWNFNNTLLITLEHKELGGGHRAAELWIGLISEGEGSDPYISYTGVTLPDLRQISHLTQLFAITKCGVHYKRFFFSFLAST